MNLQHRINLLFELGNYFKANSAEWQETKEKAARQNGWFTPAFIDLAISNILVEFLDPDKLRRFAQSNHIPEQQSKSLTVGLVMAGNIPLVGFHDWLCIFLTGHRAMMKPSAKDEVLINHLIRVLAGWDKEVAVQTQSAPVLKGCDAYIATGSNNSARYFDYYFNKFPSIIRRNRTSVAILSGQEREEELELLADDVHQYFGLGCRNVTKIYVPCGYDFAPLLDAFKKYASFFGHNKYRNNYDYQLALALLNNKFYMTNGSILLVENESVFSPISQLHYEYYNSSETGLDSVSRNIDIQCVVGKGFLPFGKAQHPALADYADGVDTMKFLLTL